MKLSIIIVSYNTKAFLMRCLGSIFETVQKSLLYEIIVVDNASADGSVEEMQNLEIKIIENKKNLGFAKANNQGVKQATGKYLLFLNPDTVVHKQTLEKMIVFMDEGEDAGVATCRIDLPNGQLDDACHRGFPTPWNAFCYFCGLSKLFPRSKLFSGYMLGWMDLTTVHEIDACAGAFMLVRRTAGEQVEWWDEDYFWYGEDLDFCYRLKEKSPSVNSGRGWKVYFVPTVSILHYKGVSGGIKSVSKDLTTASKETKALATNARFEAMRLFYKKHYQKKYPHLITWLSLRGISLFQLLSGILRA